MMPEEYQTYKKKLSSRFGLVFIEDKIIVPKNLRETVISLLHKGHPAINKMTLAARHFWWPRRTEAIQKKCESCLPCKMSGKNIKPNIPSTKTNSLPPLNNPNKEIQLDQSRNVTAGSIFYCPWTGTANGQPRVFVNLRTAKRQ